MESANPKKMLFAAVMLAVCVFGCHTINQYAGLKDDNIIEDSFELLIDEAIEKKTGYNPHIDFTPEE